MANVLAHISSIIIPALIFYIVAYGLINGSNVYEDFIKGAADGFKTVIQIMPTLIGLMMAVGILRASGFLDFLGQAAGRLTEGVGLSADLVPLIFIKLFSSSAATGLVLDIFKTYGTDSRMGLITSIMMSCTDDNVKLRRNEEGSLSGYGHEHSGKSRKNEYTITSRNTAHEEFYYHCLKKCHHQEYSSQQIEAVIYGLPERWKNAK